MISPSLPPSLHPLLLPPSPLLPPSHIFFALSHSVFPSPHFPSLPFPSLKLLPSRVLPPFYPPSSPPPSPSSHLHLFPSSPLLPSLLSVPSLTSLLLFSNTFLSSFLLFIRNGRQFFCYRDIMHLSNHYCTLILRNIV